MGNKNSEYPPSSYLLHIYRRCDSPSEVLIGTLEKLGNGAKDTFHSSAELLKLLGMNRSDSVEEPGK